LGKTRKRAAQKFDVLLKAEFYGFHDSWTEYLCLARNPDGSITLTSRAREILAEAGRYKQRGWLPGTIRRKDVWGFDGEYVVGEKLLPHDGDAELTVPQDQFDVAVEWLMRRKWHLQAQFGEAWAQIRAALYSPKFFNIAKPLPLFRSTTSDHPWKEGWSTYAAGYPDKGNEGTQSQAGSGKPCEIVIRCPGPPEPWVVWLEIVFIEWSGKSFSVYARTGEAVDGGKESPGLMPPIPGRLSWRTVLMFVQSHDVADVSGIASRQIDIYGMERWQKDVIAAAMLQLSTIVDFLSSLPDRELKALHARLGGFLSVKSRRRLEQLAVTTRNSFVGRKSLAETAELVGSPDPMDTERLAEDCAAYDADRDAELLLEQYRGTPALPAELFLSLLHRRRPRPTRLRAGYLSCGCVPGPSQRVVMSWACAWTMSCLYCTGCCGSRWRKYSRPLPTVALTSFRSSCLGSWTNLVRTRNTSAGTMSTARSMSTPTAALGTLRG
jgi:hypothetical protein